MTVKKRGLGRGLDVLLGSNTNSSSLERNPEKLRTLPIEYLQTGRFQPRRIIDPAKLQELADSISAQGIVQPVIVREQDDGRYEIIAGERRWRAAQLAGLREVPVVVRDISDQTAQAIALIENIQREDLNPMEEAEALQKLLEDHGMTHQQLADAVGKSRATISNLVRLMDLHPATKQLLLDGRIEMGHARALLGLESDAQVSLANKVAEKKLTVRATELLVQQLRENKNTPNNDNSKDDPDIRRLEDELSGQLGNRVQIRHGKKGNGQLIIKYDTLDQLEGVLERLR